MTDDRYTVEDPPGDGGLVYAPFVHDRGLGESWFRYDIASEDARVVLERGLLHRTLESAEAHAQRMLMADDILKALEMLLRAQDSESPTWREHVTRGARAVAAKARGEVAP